MMQENEIPKYLKSTESNISKSNRKSKHKDYIREVNSPIGRCYSRISDEELYEKYHNKLPVFFVEDIFKERYVNLEGENK